MRAARSKKGHGRHTIRDGIPMTKASEMDSALEREIGALADLTRPALVERWQALYRGNPPKGLSRRLLILAIAYRIQAKRYGGLTPAARRKLGGNRVNGAPPNRRKPEASAKLASGTRLIREWNGTPHVVDVADGHFIWNGAQYRSLSAVAQAITGARWSGPRFFGLTSEGGP
jgi:hypothetical protein